MHLDPDYGHCPPADRATLRRDLTQIIERAIEALDALEADTDAEQELGWTLGVNQEHALAWCTLDASGTAEPDDHGGGDINDEPHDAEDDMAADPDALHLLRDEFVFSQMMSDTRVERHEASNAALQQLADMTGQSFRAVHWPRVTMHPKRPPSREGLTRLRGIVNGVPMLVEITR
ncbi:hypothetical protein LGR54_04345 [Ancylobacter sp. Lp-2]|uniref:hypothetical protein n=1 Tax=Ancylobacter sp. Lp-2 TaxID=2881339 RepID=UPI001E4DE09F|nr:hypothetical protein [Ancylobacter sp. Lp-2]MCB4767824.1 hypothetical protein [Ancylobacter sp. Lp-2]